MQMSKNVNNDVSKDPPIDYFYTSILGGMNCPPFARLMGFEGLFAIPRGWQVCLQCNFLMK